MSDLVDESTVESPDSLPEAVEKLHSKNSGSGKVVLGLVLLLPALLAVIFTRYIPAIRTLLLGFQDASFFDETVFVGFDNYQRLFETPITGQAAVFTLLLALVRVLAVLVGPLFLALGAAKLKKGWESLVRVIAMVPLAAYSPVALALTWFFLLNPIFGFGGAGFSLQNPDSARVVVLLLDGLSFFGLASGVGLTVYLAAFMDAGDRGRLVRTTLLLGTLLVTGTLALSFQSRDFLSVLTGGGPAGMTATLMMVMYHQLFMNMRIGLAAAIATPIMLIFSLLGVVLLVVMIISRLRLAITRCPPETTGTSRGVRVVGIILMVLGLIGVLVSLLPYVMRFLVMFRVPGGGYLKEIGDLIPQVRLGRVMLNTWLKPAAFILGVQFPVTYLAAVGIGGLRPLGKASPWILVIFAPFLLVSIMALLPGLTMMLVNLGLARTTVGLGFPYLINIPMLFVLTFFFLGMDEKREAREGEDQRNFFRAMILPSLPLAALMLVVGLLTMQQSLGWTLAVVNQPEQFTLPVMIHRVMVTFAAAGWQGILGMVTALRIPAFLAGLGLYVVFQILYLRKITIRTGRSPEQKK